MSFLRLVLMGGAGFGVGGAIGGATGEVLLGTFLQGAIGGAFLGFALMRRNPFGMVLLTLFSAFGLFVGTMIALLVEIAYWQPSWYILFRGMVAGMSVGGALGISLRVWGGVWGARVGSWWIVGILTLAGTVGFGMGWVALEGTFGHWPSVWVEYPDPVPGTVVEIPTPGLLFFRMFLQGTIGGAFLGAALGIHQRLLKVV